MTINCADLVTLLTGNLTVSINRLYQLYNGLTGDDLYTHQLPRAFRACQPHAEQAFPRMAEWLREPGRSINEENWKEIIAEAQAAFGDSFHLDPLADWLGFNPLAELISMQNWETEGSGVVVVEHAESEDSFCL